MKDGFDTTEFEGLADLNRDDFFAEMIGQLAGTLEDVVGIEDASGFVALVGDRVGNDLSRRYDATREEPASTPGDVAAMCKDLKARIGGSFVVEDINDDEIVFTNCDCPFAERVEGRPSLCMMTTNVFGRIAANALGFARIHVEESIATGHDRCRVVVGMTKDSDAPGHEFFR